MSRDDDDDDGDDRIAIQRLQKTKTASSPLLPDEVLASATSLGNDSTHGSRTCRRAFVS